MAKDITCKACNKSFLMRSIVQHIEKSKCRTTYSDEEISRIKKLSKQISAAKRKERDGKRHEKTYDPTIRAEQYKQSIGLKEYDPQKRKEQYAKAKPKISEKYRKNKKQILSKIKELKKKKNSKGGKVFSRLCKWIFPDMFHDHWTDHFDRAFEIEEEERTDFFEDEAMHDLFADELWISKFDEKTYNCETHLECDESNRASKCNELAIKQSEKKKKKQFCVEHMSDLQMGKLIQKSMKEKYQEEIKKWMTEFATNVVEKEFKFQFGSQYNPQYLPDMYSEVEKRCYKKAFTTLFVMTDNDVYVEANKTALDKLRERKEDKELEEFLIEELEELGNFVAAEVYDIFKTEFTNTLEKKFFSFKNTMPRQMKSANRRKKRWALKRLARMEKIEAASMDEEKKNLIEEAKVQIEQIFKKYEKEIADGYKNCDVPFEDLFCFTEVVDQYPGLDFLNTGGKDPLFPWVKYDEYLSLDSETWKQIEKRKEKCSCNTCTSNLHSTAECERVIRQRLEKIPFRTCPLCQEQIPHGAFDNECNYRRHIILVSESKVTCDNCNDAPKPYFGKPSVPRKKFPYESKNASK